ncbi:MAG: hypothetical protein ACRC2J_10870 [Microcoleaceae cyanobacterium]
MWPNNINNHLTKGTIVTVLLTVTVGCELGPQPRNQSQSRSQSLCIANQQNLMTANTDNPLIGKKSTAIPNQPAQPVSKSSPNNSLTQCANRDKDSFDQAGKLALEAAVLAQKAKTKEEWDQVSADWVRAIASMQEVEPNSPKRLFAEKKVLEYMQNLAYAQGKASNLTDRVAGPSFNSDLLDQQLELYLSYVAAVGRPDILIVGSSRALQGIDPTELKHALSRQGYPDLKIFNFGINGATAQVVDFQLRQLLTAEQLPRLILWADGVRAFNSGRQDKTFDAIASSEGKKLLNSGIHPQLPSTQARAIAPTKNHKKENIFLPQAQAAMILGRQLDQSDKSATIMTNKAVTVNNQPDVKTSLTLSDIAKKIDAQGFLPITIKYNPAEYYQKFSYVPGDYDRDYAKFNLGGEQAIAMQSILNFVQAKNIPLMFVNLPLTDDYLDNSRWSAEQQFQQWLKNLAGQSQLILVDMNNSQTNLTRNENFVDPSHLNRYGARAVARALANMPDLPWPRNR